jgi:hypothetical protein
MTTSEPPSTADDEASPRRRRMLTAATVTPALAHPTCVAAIDLLSREVVTTATQLGGTLDESPATMSFQLGELGAEMSRLLDRSTARMADRDLRPDGAMPVTIVIHGHPLPPTPSGN